MKQAQPALRRPEHTAAAWTVDCGLGTPHPPAPHKLFPGWRSSTQKLFRQSEIFRAQHNSAQQKQPGPAGTGCSKADNLQKGGWQSILGGVSPEGTAAEPSCVSAKDMGRQGSGPVPHKQRRVQPNPAPPPPKNAPKPVLVITPATRTRHRVQKELLSREPEALPNMPRYLRERCMGGGGEMMMTTGTARTRKNRRSRHQRGSKKSPQKKTTLCRRTNFTALTWRECLVVL